MCHSKEYADCHKQHPHDVTRHVRHAAIGMPPTANPFQLIEAYQAFTLAFQQVQHQGNIPTGYGVAQAEWVDGLYPEREVITVDHSKRYMKWACHLLYGGPVQFCGHKA